MEQVSRLGPDGTLAGDDTQVTLSEDQIREALRAMFLAREMDTRMVSLQRQGRMGTFSSVTGQEATIIGASLAIEPTDWLVPAYREAPAMLRHGYPLSSFMLYWKGSSEGGRIPDDVRMLPVQIALAAQLPHAVGLGWGMALQGSDRVVLTFFGDGAASEGDAHESMNLAGVMKAPVIFLLQNNGWAISTPRSLQSAAEHLAQRAEGYGIPGVLVDGNDILAVHEVVSQAVARARAGEGPTLIEAVMTRMAAHNTADDPTKYREATYLEQHAPFDPLERLFSYALAQGVIEPSYRESVQAEVAQEVTDAITEMEAYESRGPELLFEHVTHEPSARLLRQREAKLGEAQDV